MPPVVTPNASTGIQSGKTNCKGLSFAAGFFLFFSFLYLYLYLYLYGCLSVAVPLRFRSTVFQRSLNDRSRSFAFLLLQMRFHLFFQRWKCPLLSANLSRRDYEPTFYP